MTPSTGVECAAAVVPVDYSNPENGNLEIALSRRKATDPARRRGVLLTNPGGSGLSAVNWFTGQTDVLRVYDVIGVDPRGVGYSYGTQLGSVYGSMFPTRLDRSVLDSALDPLKTWHEQDVDVVDAIVENLRKWTEWTAARHGTYGLGTTPAAVRGELDAIAEKLKSGPHGGYADVTSFDHATGAARYRRSWAAFARHIASIKASTSDPAEAPAVVSALRRGDIEPTSPGPSTRSSASGTGRATSTPTTTT
ncbi:hypothetical protein BBK82_25210 [Lentzea guizhouensis]|uniref:Uncharacterized protein n=1 Tax=Lentzea guizhouensis TaxID=1586287 RepID=A0A1B2HMD3_9PSEU|nr:alpha/beta fold hydrolase [Lentzea guizhouensis]ANZ38878.1 hypothetical protein BBK82_25210 [Lentzea guizhouensis]